MLFHQISHKARPRTVSWSLAIAGAAALSIASLSGAPAANAAPAASTSINFTSGNTTFRVGGHTWTVSVFSSIDVIRSSGIAASTGHESDSWNFSSAPLSVNHTTGDATFNSANSFAPVAFVNLKFTTTKRHQASCTSGSETIFTGNVSGSLTLHANTKGLTFKNAHAKFSGGSVSIDHGCVPPSGPNVCAPGVWGIGSNGGNAAGTAQSLPGGVRTTFVASVFENISLKAPKGASVDIGVAGGSNKPVFNSTKKTLQVSARGVITGSALIKATAPPALNHSPNCVVGGKHYTDHDATYTASFTSPRGGQFQARSIVVGLIKAPRTGFCFFDIHTFKLI